MTVWLILLIAFILRIIPRLISKNSWNYDTYFHMAISRIIKKHNYKIPKDKGRFSLDDNMDYPWLFHWLFSFVPDKNIYLAEKISSAIIDVIHIALAMLISHKLFINLDMQNANGHLWVGFLMAISPSFLRIGMGPRAYNATPRVLSQLLLFIFFVSLAFFYQEGSTTWLIIGLICSVLINISSIFGFQFIWFISIILALFGFYEALVLTIIGLMISFLIFGNKVYIVIRGNVLSMKYYYSTLAKNYVGLIEQKACISCYFKRFKQNFLTTKMLNWFMMDQYPLHILIFFMPQALIVLFYQDYLSQDSDFLFIVFLSSFILFLLVLIPKLVFIGEAERYLEHTLFIQIFLFVEIFANLNNTVLIIISIWYMICYTQYIRLYLKYYKNIKVPYKLIEQIDKEENIIYPLGQYSWILLYNLKKAKICYYSTSWTNSKVSQEDLHLITGNYPYPGTNLRVLKQKFGITHILTNELAMQNYKNFIKNTQNDNLEFIDKEDNCMIYKIEDFKNES